MSLKPAIRRALSRFGYQIGEYRPFHEFLALRGIDLVLDVGANRGQYVDEIRAAGYGARVVSFEPQRRAFEEVARRAASDPHWDVMHLALGEKAGICRLNVYSDDRFSSIHDFQDNRGPQQTGVEICPMRTLDEVLPEIAGDAQRIFVKLDTQGSEREIIAGATAALDQVTGMLVELPLAPIYRDQPPMEDLIALLRARGFEPWHLRHVYIDEASKRSFEYDGIFFRR